MQGEVSSLQLEYFSQNSSTRIEKNMALSEITQGNAVRSGPKIYGIQTITKHIFSNHLEVELYVYIYKLAINIWEFFLNSFFLSFIPK